MCLNQYYTVSQEFDCAAAELNQFVLSEFVLVAAGLVSGHSSFTVLCQIPVFVPKFSGILKNKSFLQNNTNVWNYVIIRGVNTVGD